MCEIIADATPRATLGMLPAAGHMSPITHPKEVAGRIARHISTHVGSEVLEHQVRVLSDG